LWRGRLEQCGPVAQLVEQRTFNAWVAGSIPAGLTMGRSTKAALTAIFIAVAMLATPYALFST
jgi:hypothetical protein